MKSNTAPTAAGSHKNPLVSRDLLESEMRPEFTIRTANNGDETKVSALLLASYPAAMSGSYSADVLDAALPWMTQANPKLLKSSTFYVAETQDGTVVGCGGWTSDRPGTGELVPQLAHIRHFATHPQWLRRGIGRAIYLHCEGRIRSTEARTVECFASLNAEAFYRALGFETAQRVEVAMGADVMFPAVLMTKRIG
jgi:ribosomal protein S18 acetylase RimI-like enzyme